MDNFADSIRTIPFFAGFSREDLARIAGKLDEEKLATGNVVFSQGEDGDALYVVRTGAVEVFIEHDGAGGETLAILGSHECFGEMALFTGEKRSATVRALVDTSVLKLTKANWEELLAKHPSLSFHFCKVLSRRLAETDRDVSKGRGAFNQIMEEFFAGQPPHLQDFLMRTSVMESLEPEAIGLVLQTAEPAKILTAVAFGQPMILRRDGKGLYTYPAYVREFLTAKLERSLGKESTSELHCRFAAYFAQQARWIRAIHHWLKAEKWENALDLITAHAEEFLDKEHPKKILTLLDALPLSMVRTRGDLARLRAEAHVRLGDLDAAVQSYQNFLRQKRLSAAGAFETARYYQELAELHRKKGEIEEALGCLHVGTTILQEDRIDLEAVEAMQSIELLEQQSGRQQGALEWSKKALNVAGKLERHVGATILTENKKWLGVLLSVTVAWGIWQIPPPEPLGADALRFLATLAGAVILWMFEVFEEHVVAVTLLISWLAFNVVPTEMAFSGFSESSWFLALGVLGMGAGVTTSGLLYRVALQVLRRAPPSYKILTFIFVTSGLVVTPLFPQVKGRLGIMIPLTQTISEAMGFKARSNGSAGLAFATYIGFSQATFMFLTGATVCIVGWNLLPQGARLEFGWGTWVLAVLPAGFFTLLCLFIAIHVLFRIRDEEKPVVSSRTLETQLEILGALTNREWLSSAVLALVAVGWVGKPLHGISESTVALGAFGLFLITGVLDKKGLKNNVDWGYLLFLGVVSGLADIMPQLKINEWLAVLIEPVLLSLAVYPVMFLFVIALLVYGLRFFLKKIPTMILLLLALVPLTEKIGIHPGIVLLTILMAMESWFLPYQTDSYQIAYYSTDEKAFSHAQARKLMVVKFFVSLLAIAISVPYWRLLGFIH